RQATPNNPLKVVRHVSLELANGLWLLTNDFVERIDRVFAFECFSSRNRFVQDAAKGKDVRTMIDLVHTTLRLFRRHVANRAHDRAGRGLLRENGGGYLAAC